MKELPTVAIIYGWAEGRWQSQRFVRELEATGFRATDEAGSADIIFAHSSGCYQVPQNVRAKLILLVGLPYWPNRSLASGIIRKLVREIRHHRRHKGVGWWLNKILHNSWYIISKPRATYYGLTRHAVENLPPSAPGRVVLVRPSDDTLMHPDVSKLLARSDYELVEIPGAHDDCWIDPSPYIELIAHFRASI